MSLRPAIVVPIITVMAAAALVLWHERSSALLDTSTMHVVPDRSERFPGGATSVADTGIRSFGRLAMNSTKERYAGFAAGKSIFGRNWLKSVKGPSPVGPLFSAVSCEGCHDHDGRGRPPYAEEEAKSMIIRLAHFDDKGAPVGSPYGEQLDYHAREGSTPEGMVSVSYQEPREYFNDGSSCQMHRPVFSFSNMAHGALDTGYRVSPRVAPVTFGLGLLEAVPERTILAAADPDDRDGDGISGRPNYVTDRITGSKRLGRFGWKGAQPTLRQQIAAAFRNDMGITSSIFSASTYAVAHGELGYVELTDKELNDITFYLTVTAVPNRRAFDAPATRHGQAIFNNIGCASCHVPSMRTETVAGFPEISDQKIYPYTDLLLHDMGEGLSDNFPEGSAAGSEWRTPPLWGLGLIPNVNKHTRLLHDGRARSVEEAILWHGGEAERAARLFRTLSREDRAALVAFLYAI